MLALRTREFACGIIPEQLLWKFSSSRWSDTILLCLSDLKTSYHLLRMLTCRSPAAPKPKFIITGFGRFCGVAKNPTEQLVNWLQQRTCHTKTVATADTQQDPAISTAPGEEQAHYCVSSLDVLEVSADAVDQFMEQQQKKLLQQAADSSEGPQPVVLLHFGVDTQVSSRQGSNRQQTDGCRNRTEARSLAFLRSRTVRQNAMWIARALPSVAAHSHCPTPALP